MSSLRNILNPERKRSVKLLVIPPEQSTSTWEPPVSHPSPGSSSEDDLNDYNPLIHIPHPDCPDSLACLPDTDGRPQHTLPVILRCAILGSPRKRLTIREIYAAMEEKYAYYRTAGPTWKQSVRHHLSLNRLFERQPRPATDPGFGSYWTVNLAAPPGTKRPRKRGRPNKDAKPKKDDPPEEGPSTKPRRGRPRKDDSPVPAPVPISVPVSTASTPPIVPLIEPPIEPPIDPLLEAAEALVPPPVEEDAGGDRMASPTTFASPLPLASPHHLLASPSHFPIRRNTPQYFSSESGHSEEIVEQLQREMAVLRRQSAEAHSLSLRLSDQLVAAREEASQSQLTMESMEAKIREEVNRRKQAEREADEAMRARRAAEEALKSMRFHPEQPRPAR
ncbi:hypothetical protein C8R47DRAFT_1183507 [Mycena vitilis]|nr:hypothetical protein C8R47DRAFT_1183507 [Mycena vitilis]